MVSMNILSERPVFAVDGEVFHWGDVVRHARSSGRWDELETLACQGLACEAHFETIEEEGAEEAIDEAAAEFRYERELITAEEMEAWLEARGLTPEEWMGYIRRTVLRQLWADDLDDIAAEHPVGDGQVEEALRVDLLCSGTQRILAEELAVEAAAAAARGEASPAEPPADREGRLAALRERAGRFRQDALAPETLAREIASNQMEWMRVDCRAIAFAEEGAGARGRPLPARGRARHRGGGGRGGRAHPGGGVLPRPARSGAAFPLPRRRRGRCHRPDDGGRWLTPSIRWSRR